MTFSRTALCVALALCVLAVTAAHRPAAAQFADIDEQTATAPADETAAAATTVLSADELREIVAPVAFYPDDLLAIVLPAAIAVYALWLRLPRLRAAVSAEHASALAWALVLVLSGIALLTASII